MNGTRRIGRPPTDPQVRFDAQTRKTDTCWHWIGAPSNQGYGRFRPGGDAPKQHAHRFAYEQAHGPIPDGQEVDHLCRNRLCVNPGHLEVVTRAENLDRRDAAHGSGQYRSSFTCGHAFTVENTYRNARASAQCRTCARLRMMRARAGRNLQ